MENEKFVDKLKFDLMMNNGYLERTENEVDTYGFKQKEIDFYVAKIKRIEKALEKHN